MPLIWLLDRFFFLGNRWVLGIDGAARADDGDAAGAAAELADSGMMGSMKSFLNDY